MSQLQRLAIAPSQLQDSRIYLAPEQQHYLGRVLRLQPGDRFIAMDGRGQWWLAGLEMENAQLSAIAIESLAVDTELPIALTAIVALPKGSAFDDIVRQSTELGVSEIVPAIGDRTLLRPSANKIERWRRIAREAAEQSERQFIPTVRDPQPFATAIGTENDSRRYLCLARGEIPHLLDRLQAETGQSKPISIAIGPEGGWTDAEIDTAIAAGFHPVSLGRRILRAATAPTVALSLIAGAIETHKL
jgi:16S rRNA (uracil1498-N3)-methyltransferase